MKNSLLLLLGLGVAFASCKKDPDPEPAAAIQFSLAEDSSFASGRFSSFEIDAYVKFKNLEDKSITLNWKRFDENAPAGWEIATCDNETCHSPAINVRSITVAAKDSFEYKIVFRPNSTAGIGSAKTVFYDPADSARTAKTVFFSVDAN